MFSDDMLLSLGDFVSFLSLSSEDGLIFELLDSGVSSMVCFDFDILLFVSMLTFSFFR